MKPKPNKEVREFWLLKRTDFGEDFEADKPYSYIVNSIDSIPKYAEQHTHAIEYSAYQALQKRVEGLEAMLAKCREQRNEAILIIARMCDDYDFVKVRDDADAELQRLQGKED